MPLPRIVHPGVPHHVILRGNNRRRLCSYADDYLRLLRYVGEGLARFPCLMQALVVMSNHIHLLLVPDSARALASFVAHFAHRYAMYRNRTQGSSGKLFEDRFSSFPVLTEERLATTIAYIELNPVRGGLVEHPRDYLWSTYRLHAGDHAGSIIDPGLWTPSDWYVGLGDDPGARAERYERWVEECRNEVLPELEARKHAKRAARQSVAGRIPRRPDGKRAA